MHHTASPPLSQRPRGFTAQHIRNLKHYYNSQLGWSSGPHLFIDEDEVFGMCAFHKKGVHAKSFNSRSIGIEVLGYYDHGREDPKSGRGLQCWTNTAATVRVLLDWLKINPNKSTILFHRDDPRTSKTCPGSAVDKDWFLKMIPSGVSGPVLDPVLFDKPDVGMPWEDWHFAGEAWCVPVLDFLVARGTPKSDVVASLKKKSKDYYYRDELIEGAFYALKTSTLRPRNCTWAPALELLEISNQNIVPLTPSVVSSPEGGSQTLQFGRILPGSRFKTSESEFFISSSDLEVSATEAKKLPFSEVRELESHFAAIRGVIKGDTIRNATLVEVAPPISSGVFAKLVDTDLAVRDRVLSVAREVRDELTGEMAVVPTHELPLAVAPSGPLPLCVLDIGHSKSRPGACGKLKNKKMCEFAFNTELAEMIKAKVKNAEITILSRPDTADGYSALPGRINGEGPNFAISLHANGNGPNTSGTEVLYWHSSKNGKRLAAMLQDELLGALKLNDRGVKPRRSNDRGGKLLQRVKAPIVIGEPFFITNVSDLAKADAKKDKLATAYAKAIDEYAGELAFPEKTVTSTKVVGSHFAPSGVDFEFKTNLSKSQFFSRNDKELMRLIDLVNSILVKQYSADCVPITRHDVWALTYCECGLRNGKVDPDHRHSEGERGMLPLPENVKYWNGDDAPAWDRVMPIGRNLEHFYLYLGQLKNKAVTTKEGRTLYRDLFRVASIYGNPVREAKLLAGVVHGYFYSGTYSDRRVPFEKLLSGYKKDTPLSEMMKNTRYVHAGKSFMKGREENIEAALKLV